MTHRDRAGVPAGHEAGPGAGQRADRRRAADPPPGIHPPQSGSAGRGGGRAVEACRRPPIGPLPVRPHDRYGSLSARLGITQVLPEARKRVRPYRPNPLFFGIDLLAGLVGERGFEPPYPCYFVNKCETY